MRRFANSKAGLPRPDGLGTVAAKKLRRAGLHMALLVALSSLVLATACNNLDDIIAKGFPAPTTLAGLEQGYVEFDDTGNILVVVNNLEFATNSLFNETSYVGAWVFKRGADPRSVCCYDEFEDICSAAQENACMIGMGFSNDLGYAGSFYLDIHPPRAFPKYAPQFRMPIYVADKDGVPQDYQGEYNSFSSPVNAVGDREQYDLYLGVFYTVYDSEQRLRPKNITAEVGDVSYYSAVRPDFLSPVIPIESRFYSETAQDPPGSWYPIPHLASWSPVTQPVSLSLKGVVINEVGYDIGANTNNDFVELYNTNNYDVDLTLSGATLMRDSGCSVSGGNITEKSSLSGIIPAKGYWVVTRAAATAAITNVSQFWSTDTSKGTVSSGYCIILASSKTSPTSATSTNVIDWVTMGGAGDSEGGVYAPDPTAGNSISRCPNGTDTNNNAADFKVSTAVTTGGANSCP